MAKQLTTFLIFLSALSGVDCKNGKHSNKQLPTGYSRSLISSEMFKQCFEIIKTVYSHLVKTLSRLNSFLTLFWDILSNIRRLK